jgi:hypothetical protein
MCQYTIDNSICRPVGYTSEKLKGFQLNFRIDITKCLNKQNYIFSDAKKEANCSQL